MSYLEPLSFCSIDEYRRHEPNRLGLDDIEAGELYTMMSELKEGRREASRSTVRVLGVAATSRLVTVMFHDEKLEEVFEADTYVDENNYILPEKKIELVDRRWDQATRLARSYLRDYFEDIYDHMLAQEKALESV